MAFDIWYFSTTVSFSGELRSSEEGEVKWVSRNDLDNIELAYDLKNLLRVFH